MKEVESDERLKKLEEKSRGEDIMRNVKTV